MCDVLDVMAGNTVTSNHKIPENIQIQKDKIIPKTKPAEKPTLLKSLTGAAIEPISLR